MKIIMLLISLILYACGGKVDNPNNTSITAEQVNALLELKTDILEWAPTCTSNGIEHACEGTNDDHVTLFSGLLCLSGQTNECDAAGASLDESGRLWRNPHDADVGEDFENSSSRDMVVGFMSYLVASKDAEKAERFVNYLKNNDYKICPTASDNRCEMSPVSHYPLWATLKDIYEYIGLSPTKEMKYVEFGDETLLKWQAEFSPRGFGLHLIASQLFIRQETSDWTKTLQSAGDILFTRAPDNPYFEYVSQGKTYTAAEKVFRFCPQLSPQNPSRWLWEKDSVVKEAEFTMGHDCVFIINLLTQ